MMTGADHPALAFRASTGLVDAQPVVREAHAEATLGRRTGEELAKIGFEANVIFGRGHEYRMAGSV